MTTIDPIYTDCDFTVAVGDASVIVRDKTTKGDLRIIRAIFFGKNVVDIGQKIKDGVGVTDPTGISESIILIFYGTTSLCKSKLREIDSGPLILSNPKKTPNSVNGHTVLTSSSSYEKVTNNQVSDQQNSLYTLKRYFESISNKIDLLLKNLNERLESIEEKIDNHLPSANFRDPSLSITDHAMTEMATHRNDPKWRRRIKHMEWPQLNDGQIDMVRYELLKGNKAASKTAISLAKIIYGDKLKTHILGEKGRLVRAPRDGERALVIPLEDEQILRDILSCFGNDLFNDPTNWEVLVRGPVNQCGRERKRKRNASVEKNISGPSGLESSTQIPDKQNKKSRRDDSEGSDIASDVTIGGDEQQNKQ